MHKTAAKRVLELEHGVPLRQVLITTLEKQRGQKSAVFKAAVALDISAATVREWCRDEDINIDDHIKQER